MSKQLDQYYTNKIASSVPDDSTLSVIDPKRGALYDLIMGRIYPEVVRAGKMPAGDVVALVQHMEGEEAVEGAVAISFHSPAEILAQMAQVKETLSSMLRLTSFVIMQLLDEDNIPGFIPVFGCFEKKGKLIEIEGVR